LSKPQPKQSSDPPPSQRYPVFDQEFREGLAWWFKTDRPKAEKILDLVTDVMEHPFTGLGKPEPLKYLGADLWSRRIDLEHRLVYRVVQTRIDFLSCRYHYGE
jgi:toxin YoeB